MPKKLIELLVVCILIFAGIWIATSFVSLQEQLQIFGLIAIIALAIISIAFRKVPLDCKIICALILGYAFAGKGFAYITPIEPFYIGEIVWCIGLLGLFYRFTKGVPLFPNKTNVVIFLWMVTVGLFLLSTFKTYGTLAIRDSAMGYYAMFAFYGYAIFVRNDIDRFFGYILKISIFFACISFIILTSGAYHKIAPTSAVISALFIPHPDSFIPLIAAGAMYGLLEGMRRKSALRILAGITLVMMLFATKTAGIFSFFVLVAYMIVIGRRTDLIFTASVCTILGAIAIGLIISFGSVEIDQALRENEHLQAFSVGTMGGIETAANTNWRLAWWEILFKDTMRQNPLFGLGLGSDISSHFLQTYLRIDLSSEEAQKYARYPHNILLTVFGRMGFVGIFMFAVLLISLAQLFIRTTRLRIQESEDGEKTVLLAQMIVIAGIANGLVQSTYEVPYGAITHWFCIGYIIAYWQKTRRRNAYKASIAPQTNEK